MGKLFCTLCGREVDADKRGHFPCSHCAVDHAAQTGAHGRVYLARVFTVHQMPDSVTYTALSFAPSWPQSAESGREGNNVTDDERACLLETARKSLTAVVRAERCRIANLFREINYCISGEGSARADIFQSVSVVLGL
jgi:hypothetical protein